MKERNYKQIISFTLFGFLIAILLFFGFLKLKVITVYPFSDRGFNYSLPQNATSSLIEGDFSIFWEALDLVKSKYYNPEIFKDEKVIYGAINGALQSLDDPYTVFLDEEDSKKFNEDLGGSFGGIGAEIGMKNNQILIIAPLKGAPAEKIGLKAGDQIIKINETSTLNMSVDKAVKLIRGTPGTIVKLTIFRDEWNSTKEFTIKREIIKIPTMEWKILDGNIAYVKMFNFYSNATVDFYNMMVKDVIPKAPRGLILDLRNNPGGFLDVAQNISGWFLKKGDVFVLEKVRSGETKKLYAYGNEALSRIPTVLIVNSGSASASEILAGALRDNRGIKIVGEQTFGKGSVQELNNLRNGSSLKITIAEWLTPKGEKINKIGLKPDFEIKAKEGDKTDVQLEKAIEVLKSIIKSK